MALNIKQIKQHAKEYVEQEAHTKVLSLRFVKRYRLFGREDVLNIYKCLTAARRHLPLKLQVPRSTLDSSAFWRQNRMLCAEIKSTSIPTLNRKALPVHFSSDSPGVSRLVGGNEVSVR